MGYIWRGMGWLVPVLAGGLLLAAQGLATGLLGEGVETGPWPLWLATGLSALAIGVLGLALNAGGERSQGPHTLLGIPMQYWALLLPLGVALISRAPLPEPQDPVAEIAAPQVGDRYLANFDFMFDDVDPGFPYGALEVLSVNSKGVKVTVSVYQFDTPRSLRRALRLGGEESEFADDIDFYFGFEELSDLAAEGHIFDVQRQRAP
ncbi:hypothetical protein [Ferrimonas balearica]|uniref:hypothetical protein n=1 Tax=Ferrimonas balearica TaxID=44012 RepID=UPI001C99CF7D|nr:hypothetical protein [Ferrimonas balearica]MBY5993925.1 hypothetical protein [Ferrimonas balearica]